MSDRRRRYYTDLKVQGYLLVGLIAVEVVLVSAVLYVLYNDINAVIEAHLFRIHAPEQGAWPELFRVLGVVLGLFLGLNLLLMLLIHLWWGRYIKKTVRQFSVVLERLLNFDFATSGDEIRKQHPAAELIELWYEKEKARNLRIAQLLQRLEALDDAAWTHAGDADVQKILTEYQRLLKASS